MDQFTEAYIECALWSSTDEDGNPLDEHDGEIAPETFKEMEDDCREFQAYAEELIERAITHPKVSYSLARAGHDFWLTRNGHGAGFWDRGLGDVGDALSKAAKTFGSRDLYIGDDGQIYQA